MQKRSLIFHSILLTGILMLILPACNQSGEKSKGDKNKAENGQAKIEFEKTEHDFGKIITGERVAYGFRFTNTGNSPLLISGIRSGCGCTVGDYPREPLLPGEGGRINVVFNSAGRNGFQSEGIRVITNAEQSAVRLRITAEVLQQ